MSAFNALVANNYLPYMLIYFACVYKFDFGTFRIAMVNANLLFSFAGRATN